MIGLRSSHIASSGRMLGVVCPGWNSGLKTDPHCVALWRFEDGGNLGKDSKGPNDLADNGATQSGFCKEGKASAQFLKAHPDNMERTDANLSTGFPLKTGDATKLISATAWFRLGADPDVTYRHLLSKWIANKMSWNLNVLLSGGNKLSMGIGFAGGGTSMGYMNGAVNLNTGEWYHAAATWKDSDRSYRILIYREATDTEYDWAATGTVDIYVGDAPWRVGNSGDGTNGYDGLLDEVAVFNKILTVAEIRKIRKGTY